MLLDRNEPGEKLKGAFGIGHLSAACNKFVDTLARQAEQSSEIGLLAPFLQMRTQLRAQLGPQRCVFARAQSLPGWRDVAPRAIRKACDVCLAISVAAR